MQCLHASQEDACMAVDLAAVLHEVCMPPLLLAPFCLQVELQAVSLVVLSFFRDEQAARQLADRVAQHGALVGCRNSARRRLHLLSLRPPAQAPALSTRRPVRCCCCFAAGGVLGAAVCCAERGGDPEDDWTTCEADRDVLLDRCAGKSLERLTSCFARCLHQHANQRAADRSQPAPTSSCVSPTSLSNSQVSRPPVCSIFTLAKERDLDIDFHTDENGNELARGLRCVHTALLRSVGRPAAVASTMVPECECFQAAACCCVVVWAACQLEGMQVAPSNLVLPLCLPVLPLCLQVRGTEGDPARLPGASGVRALLVSGPQLSLGVGQDTARRGSFLRAAVLVLGTSFPLASVSQLPGLSAAC